MHKAVSMDEFFHNFNNIQEFNYSVHISNEFRFVYFNNPKCACTTIKASLNMACAAALGRKLEYKSIADIHDRRRNLLLTPADIGYQRFLELLADGSFFKLCFIREPVARMVSAFASKLSWESDLLTALNRRLGRADRNPLALSEFVDALASRDDLRDMDEHWRLQRKQVCFDSVLFDKIGLFENLEADLRAVLRRLFGTRTEVSIFDVRRFFRGNTSNADTLVQNLAKDTMRKICEIYREDVDLYAIACDGAETARPHCVPEVQG
jgi:Sulfotransferase family